MARKVKCKHCSNYAQPLNGLQTPVGFFCSYEHATKHSMEKVAHRRSKEARERAKQERLERKARKEAKRNKKWYEKKAQAVFNKWIRERDKDQSCISCDRMHQGQWHAGHYFKTNTAPSLRFDEKNVHKQCSVCNRWRSGNESNYRIGLERRIGLEELERLESDNSLKTYTVEDFKAIIKKYTDFLRGYK